MPMMWGLLNGGGKMNKPDWSKAPKGATHWYSWGYGSCWFMCEYEHAFFYNDGIGWINAFGSGWTAKVVETYCQPRPVNKAAQRAKLAPAMWREFNRLKELRAAGDYLGVRAALPAFWEARKAWESV